MTLFDSIGVGLQDPPSSPAIRRLAGAQTPKGYFDIFRSLRPHYSLHMGFGIVPAFGTGGRVSRSV